MFWNLYLNTIFYSGMVISIDFVVSTTHVVGAVTVDRQPPALLPAPTEIG